jgi:hypothetical protein
MFVLETAKRCCSQIRYVCHVAYIRLAILKLLRYGLDATPFGEYYDCPVLNSELPVCRVPVQLLEIRSEIFARLAATNNLIA